MRASPGGRSQGVGVCCSCRAVSGARSGPATGPARRAVSPGSEALAATSTRAGGPAPEPLHSCGDSSVSPGHRRDHRAREGPPEWARARGSWLILAFLRGSPPSPPPPTWSRACRPAGGRGWGGRGGGRKEAAGQSAGLLLSGCCSAVSHLEEVDEHQSGVQMGTVPRRTVRDGEAGGCCPRGRPGNGRREPPAPALTGQPLPAQRGVQAAHLEGPWHLAVAVLMVARAEGWASVGEGRPLWD